MKKLVKNNSCRSKREGFSLTEVAIVLGVMSIILAGIWSMVQNGWENQRRQQASDEITIVVNNVRGYYSGQSGVPYSANSLATALLGNGTIPGYLKRSSGTACASAPCADNPWGSNSDAQGTFRVCSWAPGTSTACPNGSNTNTVSFFAIELSGLTQSSCIAMSQRMIATTAPQGLIDVVIIGTGTNDMGSPQVTVSTAKSDCSASGNGNALIFAYKLSLSN